MEDKLQEKLEQELKDFKQEVKEMGVDIAVDKAYELTVKQEIIDGLIYDTNLSKKKRILLAEQELKPKLNVPHIFLVS